MIAGIPDFVPDFYHLCMVVDRLKLDVEALVVAHSVDEGELHYFGDDCERTDEGQGGGRT